MLFNPLCPSQLHEHDPYQRCLNEEELDGSCSEFSLDVFREKEKEEVLDRPWFELPFHLLCPFSAPLILRDLDTFRAICKSWRLSSPMSPLRPLLDPPYSCSPCLMSLVEQKYTFFHPMYDNVIYQMDTPQLWGATIRYSKYGRLLLSRKGGSVFFFHPFDTFRAICKSWRLSSPMSPIRPLLDPPYSCSPCLMSLVEQKCTFFHPMYDNVIYQMDTPQLWGAMIRYSKYGWLLLSRKGGSVFFFHPFDRIKIELPSYSNWERCESMSFSSPPTSIDCFVIGIIFYGEKFIIIRCGEVAWPLCEFTNYFRPFNDSNPLLYKGHCCWLGVREYDLPAEVGIFDPYAYLSHSNQYEYRWKYLPPIIPPKHLDNSLQNSNLLESDGNLFAVFELHEIEPSIQIYSVNISFGPRMEWHKATNIENKMLYVSSGGSSQNWLWQKI
ncbi:hypothetical protein SO802_009876 [Lithocarpus litseifolius]|uniref:KIB1-4 beta-propeller domain-containing protein n=1 Tax=Lithocarpus litseifolius TaxID=425828 RepID=A0AAW2DE14_9ROSI